MVRGDGGGMVGHVVGPLLDQLRHSVRLQWAKRGTAVSAAGVSINYRLQIDKKYRSSSGSITRHIEVRSATRSSRDSALLGCDGRSYRNGM